MYIVFKAYYVYLHFIKRNRIKQNALYREKTGIYYTCINERLYN